MQKPSLDQIEELFTELVLPFYQLERDMGLPIEKRRNETDTEHSWSLAFLACALAPHVDKTLNIGLVCQLALVHDLLEIYAGDASVWDSPAVTTQKDKEAEAVNVLAKKFGHFPWINQMIEIYERRDTNEARYVFACDKIIPLVIRKLDKGKSYIDKKLTKEQFDAGLVENRQKAHAHEAMAEYYEAMRAVFDEHPEYFYQP